MKFFVYADNLNPKQLSRRAPEHTFVATAYIPDHTIQFSRWSSQWRSGLATLAPSPGDKVWGIIVEVTDEDLKTFDEFEGDVPQGAFRHLQVTAVTQGDEKVLVTTYAANPIGKFKPKPNYTDWVIKGIKHWKLPDDCLEQWQSYVPR